jgi:uncharacterized protein
MERNVLFSRCDGPGLEHLHLFEQNGEIIADSLLIAVEEDRVFRAHYTIRCDTSWCVHSVALELPDHPSSQLHLLADGKGQWHTADGTPLPSLAGCIDVDITVTPFTNTLPIRRLHLTPGQATEITVVYFSLPKLQFQPVRQRYTCLSTNARGNMYRYEGLDSGFTTELQADHDGLILDYPRLWRSVWSESEKER